MSLHFYPLQVRAVEADTDEAVIVTFDVPETLKDIFHFQQGQYLTLKQQLGEENIRRSYSICAAVGEPLRVGVRKVPNGRFSHWLNKNLQPGDTLQVMPPQGKFFVPIDSHTQRSYLGIAGGSGITPILSIMKTVLEQEPHSQFTLIYGNRSQQSTMFKEELQDLKDRYLPRLDLHYIFSDEQADVPLHYGILNRDKLSEFSGTVITSANIDHAFVCGPYQMNDEAEAALLSVGVAQERIHIERFGIPLPSNSTAVSQTYPEDAVQARIRIIRDGIQREIAFSQTHGSILNAAAIAGIDVPYSCKSGVCCTCRAKLLDGKVRMERNFALDKQELDAGFILTCQAHPLTEKITLSFDER